jgi:hypothetical protein
MLQPGPGVAIAFAMAWRWGLLMVVVMAAGACLEGRAERDGDEPLGDEASDVELVSARDGSGERRYLLAPEARDVELCAAMAEREARCYGDDAAAPAAGCAARFACSRQMWQENVVDDVYACIAKRPCSDDDPAASCLAELAASSPASEMQRRFDTARVALEEECGTVIEAAPGQSDEVYELLEGCMSNNDSCDAVSACAMMSLDLLVDDLCDAEAPLTE